MKKHQLVILVLTVASVLFCIAAFATQWVEEEQACPICGKKVECMEIMSWGGYVYDWPSKYQYIFWPKTDANFVFCCPKCHFCVYMYDFTDFPKEKVDEVKKVLKGTELPKKSHYYDIPMTIRLSIAEKVYSLLSKTDNFWCDFYRIKGYWYDQEKKTKEAAESRSQALSYAKKMIADPSRASEMKALLYISGSIHYFLNEQEMALEEFKKAMPMEYSSKEMKPEDNKGTNDFLNVLLKDFIQKIEKKQSVPRS